MPFSIFPTLPTKQPYYIVAPPYIRTSAGIKVLHMLCHTLRGLGYEAYMMSNRVNRYLDTPQLTPDILASHYDAFLTPVVVYPETVRDNPLKAPFVVRYILNYPGLLGGQEDFHPEEYRISYARGLDEKVSGKDERVLFFPASDTTVFFPPPEGATRHGSCFYAAKYVDLHQGKLFDITKDSVEITRDRPTSQTPREIADIFRRSEVFYCYENSALSLEAALCGCPVVLLPNPYFTEMIARQELGRDGIAWGTSAEELARAKATVGRVWPHYQHLLEKLIEDVKQFAEDTQRRAAATPYRQSAIFFDPYSNPFGHLHASKFKRLLRVLGSALARPPSMSELRSCWQAFRSEGVHGCKRKVKEWELRQGLRWIA